MVNVTMPAGPQKMQPFGVADLTFLVSQILPPYGPSRAPKAVPMS
jgi:hypothetical protein